MKKNYIILSIILLIAFLLRIYKLSHMVGFDFDQEYAASFALEIVHGHPIKLIGQELSVQGLYMGPFYFYYLVPFFALTGMHPIGGYIGSILLGLITIIVYYVVMKKMFGELAGFMSAFLRAVLFVKIQSDWSMVPSYSSELAIILTWYFLYKYWHGSLRYLVPLGFIMGLYTSFHPVLFPFFFVFVTILLIKRKLPERNYTIASIVLFFSSIAPLLLFAVIHKFSEFNVLFSMRPSSSSDLKNINTLLSYCVLLMNSPLNYIGIAVTDNRTLGFSLGIFTLFVIVLMKRPVFWKDSFHYVMIISTVILFLLYYFLLPNHTASYYFIGVGVLIFSYMLATLCSFARSKFGLSVLVTLIFGIAVFNFTLLYQKWQSPTLHSLADKEAVVKEIAKKQRDNKMNIIYNIDYGQQYGLGYLQREFKLDPIGGSRFISYDIVIPKSRTHEKLAFSSGDIGLVIKTP